ncbi:MAG: putative Fe-S cluster assembly protein SufT [Verrucomicrobia bacterium]|jgi:probable FeS assembly SUF system protein SufT|nr:MAG: putative Fe-S cluster assembly protein SufT [Verrucomicrobiota bacterium]MDH4470559.1 putative Fe-S cluster assembly protein SufT [Verrucomicrobiae bacterium]
MNAPQEIVLKRDCDAIQIPSGTTLILPAGTQVIVTQSLGGTYTVATPGGLARINEKDADALGLEKIEVVAPIKTVPEGTLEEAVWQQLKTVFDPEIPVNVVDLGLIYDCIITPQENGSTRAHVKMTLTAPGCGMGPTIAADARAKILTIEGIDEAEVELVWDPAWNQNMISEAGRMKLGMV